MASVSPSDRASGTADHSKNNFTGANQVFGTESNNNSLVFAPAAPPPEKPLKYNEIHTTPEKHTNTKSPGVSEIPTAAMAQRSIVLILTAFVCVFGSTNDVMSKIVANMYTSRYAFFVDQGNNVVYALLSAIPMCLNFWNTKRKTG